MEHYLQSLVAFEGLSGMKVNCICQQPQFIADSSTILDTFTSIRSSCPAIKDIFVPDSAWPRFRSWHLQENDAAHKSVLLLAMERGHLGALTSFAHRLLASGRTIRTQYAKDLQEQWMNHDDPLERHRKFRSYFGRIAELQCVEWLEVQGWTITDLEAFRAGPDIEAVAQDREPTAFEVKFIGEQDDCFISGLKSMKGEGGGGMLSPKGAADYLLYRSYEAAKQLCQSEAASHIALIVIDELTWFTFSVQLRDKWINWKNPTFLDRNDPFIAAQLMKNQNLDADLRAVLGNINEVWILKRLDGFQYECRYMITT